MTRRQEQPNRENKKSMPMIQRNFSPDAGRCYEGNRAGADQYLRWYDENDKRIRLKAKERKLLREKALTEFGRVLAQTEATGYRLGND